MTRTFVINLLSGAFPLAIISLKYFNHDWTPIAFTWIVVQTACWGCALVLLRWNRDLLGLACLSMIALATLWVLALMLNSLFQDHTAYYTINFLLEFFFAGVIVLLLRFESALVNVRENQLVIRENPRFTFRLTWLFSLAVYCALVSALFLYVLNSREGNQKERSLTQIADLGVLFLQVGCWLWIVESLLVPRVRWLSVTCLVIVSGSYWSYFLSQQGALIRAIFAFTWVTFQIQIMIIPLMYRWAGWRIAPRELVEQMLAYESPAPRNDEAR